MRVLTSGGCAAAAIIAIQLFSMPSAAGPTEEAAAEALFQEGKRLLTEGKFAEACPKLAESQRLDPAVGTLLYLGECYEKNGQIASAWATFQSAAAAGRKANQAERMEIALARAQQLATLIPRVVVTVSEGARVDGLVVKRGDTVVNAASWGVPIPLDPGEHVISASAPGKREWSRTVKLAVGQPPVTVDVPPLEDAPAGAAAPAPAAAPGAAPAPAGAPLGASPSADQGAVDEDPGASQRMWAYVAGGVGVVGLAAGIFAGLTAKGKESDADEHCLPEDNTQCTQEGIDLLDEASTYSTLSTVGFIVGGVGLVGGTVLFLTAPSGSEAPAQAAYVQISPVFGPERSGLVVTGAF